jgi:hypothetical protein
MSIRSQVEQIKYLALAHAELERLCARVSGPRSLSIKRQRRDGKVCMTVTPTITLTESLSNPDLFGSVFASSSFWTWKVVAKLIDGLPLTEQREIELFETCTGRKYNRHNRRAVRRLIMLVGRRGGKDRFFSAVTTWRAALSTDWRKHQSAGEGAVVILLGADRKQAAILRRYCHGLLQAPLLAAEVVRTTGEVTEFKNGASLEITTNNASLVRGRSAIAVLGSECCHWRTDEHAASSDEEVVGAAEPSMAICPDGGLLLLGSSVHRQRGYMFRQYRELFGNDEAEDLCWFAPTPVMNPKLPAHVLDSALAKNPSKARAEYLNVWRTDLEEFLPLDIVEACTDWGVHERLPQPNMQYFAFGDSAGGTGKDSYAFVILHIEADGAIVVDVIREWKPRFVPAQVINEIVDVCRLYHVREVYGDNAGAGFHQEDWRSHPVAYKVCKTTTSENYLSALPAWLAKRVRVLDNTTARNQLVGLERRAGAGDKETVSHPQLASAHDDVAAAICGAIAVALQAARLAAQQGPVIVPGVFMGTPRQIPGGGAYQSDNVFIPPTPGMLEAASAAAAAAPPLESIENGRKVWRGPNGETWTEPGLNEPVVARPGWLTKLLAARVNAQTPVVDLRTSPADKRGGNAAFKINGADPSVPCRGYLRADGTWQPF